VIGRVVRLGAPIAATTAMYALVYWALLATSISPLGPSVNAGLGVGFGVLEAVAWPVYLGLSVAVASIVGRRLGAGQPDEAWRAVRMLVGPSLGLGVLGGLLFTWIGPWVVHAFAADADAAREGTRYGLILAWSQPFVALEVFAEGVLAGAGDTGKVLWGTVPFNVLRVPLAWALSAPLGFGAACVWWAINATSMMKAAAKSALVWQGAWARLDPLRDD
jgi:MATE family multidrug resistance protein